MRLLTLKVILVATDLEDASFAAVVAAGRLAEAAGAVLHIVHVVARANQSNGVPGPTSGPVIELTQALSRAGARIDPANMHVVDGDPAEAISHLANRTVASVIVLGPHRVRRDASQTSFLGSTALAIVTKASAPCLIVSQPLCLPLTRVLVPIDLSETARGGLLTALSWASALRAGAGGGGRGEGAVLTALHLEGSATGSTAATTRADGFANVLEHARREAGGWAGVSIEGVETTSADVTQGIVDYATEYQPDLVVLGTRGRGLDRAGRLGSVAAAVMPRLSAPVLLVPPSVWHFFIECP